MGIIVNLIKRLIRWSVYLAVFVAAVILIPNLPPYKNFTSYELEPTQTKYKTLEHCTSLNNADKILKEKLHGPEVFRLHNGELYTGLNTGEVVKISPSGTVNIVTKVGERCSEEWQEELCGRPLSLQFDDNEKKLYVLDAYYGIWKVDLKTNKKQLLVSPRVEIEGEKPMLFNSLVLDINGDFFWSDSSSDVKLLDGFYSTLFNPSGRLFHYSAAKNSSKVLLKELAFANGVAISPNREFVIVAETMASRIVKYYINGPKKGQKEFFVVGLPGLPDNIQVLPDGSGVLVGLYTAFDTEHPLLIRSMARTPVVRKLIARLVRMLELPFEYLNMYYPHAHFEKVLYNIGHFKLAASTLPPFTGLLKIDWNGNIINCYINSDRSLATISDAVVFNNKLYLGSPHNAYIGTVPVPESLVGAFETRAPPKVNTEKITKPIPTVQPAAAKKVVENKPVPTPKPAATVPTPKPVESKPATQQKSSETKQSTQTVNAKSQPKDKQPEPVPKASKPVEQVPPVAKPEQPKAVKPNVETKPTSQETRSAKPSTSQPPKETTQKNTQKAEAKTPPKEKVTPEQIPIQEEIPSDVRKPSKETLKVIKKSGPAEIPNPNV